MKKILIITALSLFAASSAFGSLTQAIDTTNTGKTLYGAKTGSAGPTTPLIGKSSSGVSVGWFVNATGTGYALITQHKNGTKEYGSSYDSTSLFSTPIVTVGTAVLTVPTAITSADFIGGNWTSM